MTMLVGKVCFYWMMQHVDFVQFVGSLAFYIVLWSHACLRENFTEYDEVSFCGAGEPSV